MMTIKEVEFLSGIVTTIVTFAPSYVYSAYVSDSSSVIFIIHLSTIHRFCIKDFFFTRDDIFTFTIITEMILIFDKLYFLIR